MKSYDELTIQDDFLFSKVMSRPDLCKIINEYKKSKIPEGKLNLQNYEQ